MATAGQGARQQQLTAQRRVQEAERQLAAAHAAEHAWSAGVAGVAGEEQVAAALAGLEQFGWVLLHDVSWPGRPRANLDHVLVGPGGVLIVDTKNWSGTVTVDATRGLRCNGYRKTKEVAAVEAARQAVLPMVPTLVAGLICLAAQDQEVVRLDGGTPGRPEHPGRHGGGGVPRARPTTSPEPRTRPGHPRRQAGGPSGVSS